MVRFDQEVLEQAWKLSNGEEFSRAFVKADRPRKEGERSKEQPKRRESNTAPPLAQEARDPGQCEVKTEGNVHGRRRTGSKWNGTRVQGPNQGKQT